MVMDAHTTETAASALVGGAFSFIATTYAARKQSKIDLQRTINESFQELIKVSRDQIEEMQEQIAGLKEHIFRLEGFIRTQGLNVPFFKKGNSK